MSQDNKIKIRRGLDSALPSPNTEIGELRYSTDAKKLYIDDGVSNVYIGGDVSSFPISTATQVALDEINSTLNPDRILSLGTETIDGNNYTYEGYTWQLDGVQINNIGNPSQIVLPSATTGFKRNDISVFKSDGTIERVAGTETDGDIVTTPDIPEGTLYFKTYFINGESAAVEPDPTPITGTQFKQKNENQKFNPTLGGTTAVITIQPFGQNYYSVGGPVTGIVGFSKALITASPTAEVPYAGKDFYIENKTDHNVTLKNAFSPVDIPFNLGADLIVPINGIVWMKYNPNTEQMDLFFKSWSEVYVPTQNYFTFSTNTTLSNSHHNAVIWVTATINITIPSGLRVDFNCTFRTLTGAIATFLTSGTTINAESDGDVQAAKTMSFLAKYSTNNYIISGGGLS